MIYAGRNWLPEYKKTAARLRVIIVDLDAESNVQSTCLRYPKLSEICEISCHNLDVNSFEFEQCLFLQGNSKEIPLTAAYVCLDTDSKGLAAGLILSKHFFHTEVKIAVKMDHERGLGSLIPAETEKRLMPYRNISAFGFLDETCDMPLLLGGAHEVLARVFHQQYVFNEKQNGQTIATNPSMVDWELLPEDLKESNRKQADHVGVNLQATACALRPLTDWDPEHFEFSAEEVEKLARMEHERYVEERLSMGWKWAPEKNLQLRTNPTLVPWAELPETEKEKNRATIKALPVFINKAGFEIYRVH